MRERLEPRPEARLRLADALCDCADASAVCRVQVEDAIRLAEPERAQHDRLGLVAAGHAAKSRLAIGPRDSAREAAFGRARGVVRFPLHRIAGLASIACHEDPPSIRSARRRGRARARSSGCRGGRHERCEPLRRAPGRQSRPHEDVPPEAHLPAPRVHDPLPARGQPVLRAREGVRLRLRGHVGLEEHRSGRSSLAPRPSG